VGDLIADFFTFILQLVITLIQLITYPINALISAGFPDIADNITGMADTLAEMLEFFPYVMTFFPVPVRALIAFIITAEIALLIVFQSSFHVTKIWKIIQRIKFW